MCTCGEKEEDASRDLHIFSQQIGLWHKNTNIHRNMISRRPMAWRTYRMSSHMLCEWTRATERYLHRRVLNFIDFVSASAALFVSAHHTSPSTELNWWSYITCCFCCGSRLPHSIGAAHKRFFVSFRALKSGARNIADPHTRNEENCGFENSSCVQSNEFSWTNELQTAWHSHHVWNGRRNIECEKCRTLRNHNFLTLKIVSQLRWAEKRLRMAKFMQIGRKLRETYFSWHFSHAFGRRYREAQNRDSLCIQFTRSGGEKMRTIKYPQNDVLSALVFSFFNWILTFILSSLVLYLLSN